jgi:hypothetical protein
MDKVCFERPTFNMYMFILVCTIIYLMYFSFHENMTNVDLYSTMDKDSLYKTILNMKDDLFVSKLNEQKCQTSLQALQQTCSSQLSQSGIQSRLLDKVNNPLVSPESIYSSGRINSQGFDSYNQYQMVGYLSAGVGEQFPVFGRNKYPNKSDKIEYYTINEGRGRIKIPFKTKNYNELYDKDTVNIPELGGDLTFTKYEIENVRYNPNY